MRFGYGVAFGLVCLLGLAALFPPEGSPRHATASRSAILPAPAMIVQAPLPKAAVPVAVTALEASAPPSVFDPRTMTQEVLRERRAQALAANQKAMDEHESAMTARLAYIKDYALQSARDAGFDDTTRETAKAHRLACRDSDLERCVALADLYLHGSGVLSDQPLAVALYQLACEDGFEPGCMMIEKAQYSYIDRSSDEGEPRLSFEEVVAIRASRRASVTVLEDALADHNDDFRPDYYGRVTRVKDGCRAGHAADCIQLGQYFYSEYASSEQWGVKHDAPDIEAGRALYLHACELGDAVGCWNYAEAHYGMGEDDVPEIYLAYYEKSCEMGFGVACQNIGFRHELGAEIQEDEAKAAAFYNRGCDLGDAYACRSLSSLWDVGDERLRIVNELRACLHGDSLACEFMAEDFRRGRGDFPKDLVMARELLTYGCEDETAENKDEEDRDACKTLARME